MKRFYLLPVLVLCAGCLLTASDPEAEKAVEIFNELHAHLPEKTLDLKSALQLVPPEKHCAVRLEFARMATARLNAASPEMRAWNEKARIRLNVLLGFMPSDMITYDTAGALNMPAEVSHVGAVEKAALIIRGGKTDALKLLEDVRCAHVDVVTAMNQLAKNDTLLNRFNYAAACIHLADVVGVAPEDLDKLEEYEKRFNSAYSRREKTMESE